MATFSDHDGTFDVEPAEFTVHLHEKPSGSDVRGDVTLSVWFGPPIRKAFRAARRASRLLEARDHLVAAVYTLLCGIGRATKRFFYLCVFSAL